MRKLRENRHENKKLQNAWNKYGEKNFYFDVIVYQNTDFDDLNEKEISFISKYNSLLDGYNNTEGGTEGYGNNSRGKITFEQYAFIYLGNKKYASMANRTGKFLGIDSSIISAIVRERKAIHGFWRK